MATTGMVITGLYVVLRRLKKNSQVIRIIGKRKSYETDTPDTDNGEATSIIQLNQLPSFYGSHYSNPTYVTHYLTRIFPFSFVSIEIQGDKFDDPNRMFISLSRTFESATTTKDDIRELIPEFYLLPEMFQNNNNCHNYHPYLVFLCKNK